MKAYVIGGMLAAVAVPAAAQNWYDPSVLIHDTYAEVEGGAAFQGRTKANIAATGLGASEQSASQSKDFFGAGLVGFKLVDGVSIEGEGVYTRNNLSYSPSNAVYGIGGATRTYGGLGNLRFSLPFTPRVMGIGVSPYIAAGIGYGDVQYTGRNGAFSYRDKQDGFLYQGKAGVEFRIDRHIALDVGYRYLQSPNFYTSGRFNNYSILTRSSVQAATAGLKFYF